jgi:signal transduction histidine kinase
MRKTGFLREAVLIALFLGLIAMLNTSLTYSKSNFLISQRMKSGLQALARAAAGSVDADLHRTLQNPEQEKTEAYRRAVRPLENFLRSLPEIRYIYTSRLVGDTVHFVLDSAPVGDADHDGVEDHSFLMDVYEDPDEEFVVALQQAQIRVSEKPYRDKWGTFISGYAPFFASDGKLEGVVGVDMKADDFMAQIADLRRVSMWILFIQWLLCGLIGYVTFLARRHFFEAKGRERQAVERYETTVQKLESVGTFAGGIAHELNNQLAPLTGYLDLLLLDIDPKSSLRPYLVEAEQASKRCTKVISRLLSFSKPSMRNIGKADLTRFGEELKESILKTMPPMIQSEIYFEPGLWPVHCDPSQIETILVNMAVNAREAMSEGGRLEIRARNVELTPNKVKNGFTPGPYVNLSVVDTGLGISAEALSKIFDPFFTTKPRHKHSGLGLSMALRAVRDMKGWVAVESFPAKGTRFDVYLPADVPVPSERPAPAGEAPVDNHRRTILVTDDEEPLRNMMNAMLTRLGYSVLLASDGLECLEVYKKHAGKISVVFVDMIMPKCSGYQVLKRLLEFDPKATVLLMSGYTEEKSREQLSEEGARGFHRPS